MSAFADDDRGLHYGDGLFETIRFVGTHAPLWDWHVQRLTAGCLRLSLPAPDPTELREHALTAAAEHAQTVIKIVLTAGSGPRGYARPSPLVPRLRLFVQAFVARAPVDLCLRWCHTRYAVQPLLAGIKHLNRIENVLARNEWATQFDEGLMLDTRSRVIGATAANVFVRISDRWLTPSVHRSGIAGVGRRWLLAHLGAEIGDLSRRDVLGANQCVLINALRGPLAATELGPTRWQPDAQVRELQRAWQQLFKTPKVTER